MSHQGYDQPRPSAQRARLPCAPSESQGCVQRPPKRQWATPVVITSMDAGDAQVKTSFVHRVGDVHETSHSASVANIS
jgi:hypothetical protein